ncbi:MAG: DNA mismatch repair endonuclease MutL [Clostridiales bacterium]|jgi:DNA mismatch repair protein MutL|nr:DNA mismatch repair endonuclease MutL [Clostridiales bacterium]
MSKIHVLTPEVSNKIAAGEVVENPASVVKELIENAVDAGATSITAEIKNGGVSYIRITDNGFGMSAEDAKTAFTRHATSKISTAEDLEEIATLGFRGEALASIAAVSNIALMTKSAEGEGVALTLSGGNITDEQAAGCPNGTTVAVRDLFFNTPARMKFLKTDKTETARVTDIVERLILGNPRIALKYITDGKERLFYGGGGDLKACVYSVYGRDYANGVLPLSRGQNNVAVSGFAGKAELARGNRSFQSIFLNGRYVKNRALTYAAEAAYNHTLMSGKFPFFVLHLDVPRGSVDVNVHPTKQEVKFANERAVCDEVYWAVKSALQSGADTLRREIQTPAKHGFSVPSLAEPHRQLPLTASGGAVQLPVFAALAEEGEANPDVSEPTAQTSAPQDFSRGYRVAGQFFDTYIAVETGEKIILIDQHAAHERMIFERLVKAANEHTVAAQTLLSPAAVTLSPKEYGVLRENLEVFAELGFEIEEFGNNSILVRQTPEAVGEEGLKALIEELIEKIGKPGAAMTERRAAMLESVSCKAAVKGGSRLHESEITALIDDVLSTDGVSTCPHGRPLMVDLTKRELEKRFKRIV